MKRMKLLRFREYARAMEMAVTNLWNYIDNGLVVRYNFICSYLHKIRRLPQGLHLRGEWRISGKQNEVLSMPKCWFQGSVLLCGLLVFTVIDYIYHILSRSAAMVCPPFGFLDMLFDIRNCCLFFPWSYFWRKERDFVFASHLSENGKVFRDQGYSDQQSSERRSEKILFHWGFLEKRKNYKDVRL